MGGDLYFYNTGGGKKKKKSNSSPPGPKFTNFDVAKRRKKTSSLAEQRQINSESLDTYKVFLASAIEKSPAERQQ